MEKILLSIKPKWANKIFSGEKKFEFRRKIFKNTAVKTAVVYSTMPVGSLIGEFYIKGIHQDTPANIWNKTKEEAGISKDYFDEYYNGTNLAFAIEISKPILYKEPINVKERYCGFKPPQSFMYLYEGHRLNPLYVSKEEREELKECLDDLDYSKFEDL